MSRKELIVVGLGASADVTAQIFRESTDKRIKFFAVDREYIDRSDHQGRPVLALEDVLERENPEKVEFFVSIGYGTMNSIRMKKFQQIKASGFKLASLIHPQTCLPANFKFGENCFIMNGVNIHPYVSIGDNNFLWSGTTLCHHVTVGSHCWFTSGSTVAGNTNIGNRCFFGVGSSVTNNLEVGDQCFIGAGALVSKNMKDEQVVIRKGDETHQLPSGDFLKLIKNDF